MSKRTLTLSVEDRASLVALLGKGSQRVKTYKRTQALLALDAGESMKAVSQQVGVSQVSIGKWCKRYKQEGLALLYDKARSGRPVEIDGGQRAKVTALACSAAPIGHGRWTLRLLADKVVELGYCEHLSHQYAGEILKKTTGPPGG